MRFSLLVTLISICSASAVADARPRSADDDKIVAVLMKDADAIAGILEKDVDRPKKALRKLGKYLKKRRTPMKKAVKQLVVVAGELDEDARADLRSTLMWSDQTQRFLLALQGFREKWGEDPAYQPSIDKHMDELMTDGKALFDALMK